MACGRLARSMNRSCHLEMLDRLEMIEGNVGLLVFLDKLCHSLVAARS